MRTYALINENIVTSVQAVEDDQCVELSKNNQAIIDVEDQYPRPEVGWFLVGNKLEAPQTQIVDHDALDAIQQTSQRLFGLKLLPDAVDKVGARNLKLAREGTPADVAALASQMASIKLLMEGGALKTVRTLCGMIKPGFPQHADILDWVIAEITNFLTNNGWN